MMYNLQTYIEKRYQNEIKMESKTWSRTQYCLAKHLHDLL